jgi:hypothetical protein
MVSFSLDDGELTEDKMLNDLASVAAARKAAVTDIREFYYPDDPWTNQEFERDMSGGKSSENESYSGSEMRDAVQASLKSIKVRSQ